MSVIPSSKASLSRCRPLHPPSSSSSTSNSAATAVAFARSTVKGLVYLAVPCQQSYYTSDQLAINTPMATRSDLSPRFCSLLMAFHFALSASFQLNDTDWYFWFPLYAAACVVNLVKTEKKVRKLAKFALWLGLFLFIKVIIEDFVYGIAGFLSFDMRERVVRERVGSLLVICSMVLQLEILASSNHPSKQQTIRFAKHVHLGMPILVGIAYGLSLYFALFQASEMKF